MIERFEIDTEQWAVVPRVPTDEMRDAAGPKYPHAGYIFRTMLAAAPRPEAVQQDDSLIYSRECDGGHTFPCNPCCEDSGYCKTVKAGQQGGGVWSDTGHAEADRVINRLGSSDPDFDDCADAVALIRTLVADMKGPDGFATWKDAAIAERLRRVNAQLSAPRPVPTIILGKGDKLVADIFQEDEDGILHMAGVGIFDPEPGEVYGIGARNEAIDGKAITEGNPLILIWSDKPESLQVIVEELQESIARMTRPAEPDGGAV